MPRPHLRYIPFALLSALFTSDAAWAIGNPASIYCESRGGKVEIETAKDGSQTGLCVFPNGTRVNEWSYFRSTHRTTK